MWMLSLNGALEGGASATLPENHRLRQKAPKNFPLTRNTVATV